MRIVLLASLLTLSLWSGPPARADKAPPKVSIVYADPPAAGSRIAATTRYPVGVNYDVEVIVSYGPAHEGLLIWVSVYDEDTAQWVNPPIANTQTNTYIPGGEYGSQKWAYRIPYLSYWWCDVDDYTYPLAYVEVNVAHPVDGYLYSVPGTVYRP